MYLYMYSCLICRVHSLNYKVDSRAGPGTPIFARRGSAQLAWREGTCGLGCMTRYEYDV